MLAVSCSARPAARTNVVCSAQAPRPSRQQQIKLAGLSLAAAAAMLVSPMQSTAYPVPESKSPAEVVSAVEQLRPLIEKTKEAVKRAYENQDYGVVQGAEDDLAITINNFNELAEESQAGVKTVLADKVKGLETQLNSILSIVQQDDKLYGTSTGTAADATDSPPYLSQPDRPSRTAGQAFQPSQRLGNTANQ